MAKIKDLGIKVIPETMRPPEIGGGGGCTDCTVQAFSICGGTPGGGGCTDCTLQPFSICGGTPGGGGCTDCTYRPFSICGGTIQRCPRATCACTYFALSNMWTDAIACGPYSLPCGAFTNCGAISPVCAGSMDPTIFQQPGELTRDQIAKLKEQLQQQITALDEHAKTLGPKTLEEISVREKQLNEELAQLQARKKSLKK